MAADSGYEFVALPDEVRRVPRPHARHDIRPPGTGSFMLRVRYRVEQPVHIGAGHWFLQERRAVRAAVRSGDKLVIPGSSLKGMLRARYEAITKSCCPGERAPKDAELKGAIPSRKRAGYRVKFADAIHAHPVFAGSCMAGGPMCAACALFGCMSLRARVSCFDLVPNNAAVAVVSVAKRFSPRPHHLGYYDVDEARRTLHVKRLHGRKFHVGGQQDSDVSARGGRRGKSRGGQASGGGREWLEVIPKDVELEGRVVCVNVTPAEAGGLLCALGFVPESTVRIGSAKALGLGVLEPKNLAPIGVMDPMFDDMCNMFSQSDDYYRQGEQRLLGMFGGL
ncbi:MAG: hypothetical protein KDH09_06850 [Chrysiogenetes bacterium]|nr:hypothetical protein [Chrysiogenetes bacterium]